MKVTTKRKIKIVADSSADIMSLEGVDFDFAPLKIITAEKEYVDDEKLNVEAMAEDLYSYKGKSSTSCPNTEDWLKAFGDAELIFCITITATLSGSYNSATIAKRQYEEMYPDRKVFVFNSLTTGPEMGLIIYKLRELILNHTEFDQICKEIQEYSKTTGLLFILKSIKNLANNGRVNPVVAKMSGVLGIRLIGKASAHGDLELLAKHRGEHKTVEGIMEQLEREGYKGGKIKINRCFGETISTPLKELLIKKYPHAEITVSDCRGLCSFYAEIGGILVGFEKEC